MSGPAKTGDSVKIDLGTADEMLKRLRRRKGLEAKDKPEPKPQAEKPEPAPQPEASRFDQIDTSIDLGTPEDMLNRLRARQKALQSKAPQLPVQQPNYERLLEIDTSIDLGSNEEILARLRERKGMAPETVESEPPETEPETETIASKPSKAKPTTPSWGFDHPYFNSDSNFTYDPIEITTQTPDSVPTTGLGMVLHMALPLLGSLLPLVARFPIRIPVDALFTALASGIGAATGEMLAQIFNGGIEGKERPELRAGAILATGALAFVSGGASQLSFAAKQGWVVGGALFSRLVGLANIVAGQTRGSRLMQLAQRSVVNTSQSIAYRAVEVGMDTDANGAAYFNRVFNPTDLAFDILLGEGFFHLGRFVQRSNFKARTETDIKSAVDEGNWDIVEQNIARAKAFDEKGLANLLHIKTHPDAPSPAYYDEFHARVYEAMGEGDQAKRLYGQAAEVYRGHRGYEDAQRCFERVGDTAKVAEVRVERAFSSHDMDDKARFLLALALDADANPDANHRTVLARRVISKVEDLLKQSDSQLLQTLQIGSSVRLDPGQIPTTRSQNKALAALDVVLERVDDDYDKSLALFLKATWSDLNEDTADLFAQAVAASDRQVVRQSIVNVRVPALTHRMRQLRHAIQDDKVTPSMLSAAHTIYLDNLQKGSLALQAAGLEDNIAPALPVRATTIVGSTFQNAWKRHPRSARPFFEASLQTNRRVFDNDASYRELIDRMTGLHDTDHPQSIFSRLKAGETNEAEASLRLVREACDVLEDQTPMAQAAETFFDRAQSGDVTNGTKRAYAEASAMLFDNIGDPQRAQQARGLHQEAVDDGWKDWKFDKDIEPELAEEITRQLERKRKELTISPAEPAQRAEAPADLRERLGRIRATPAPKPAQRRQPLPPLPPKPTSKPKPPAPDPDRTKTLTPDPDQVLEEAVIPPQPKPTEKPAQGLDALDQDGIVIDDADLPRDPLDEGPQLDDTWFERGEAHAAAHVFDPHKRDYVRKDNPDEIVPEPGPDDDDGWMKNL